MAKTNINKKCTSKIEKLKKIIEKQKHEIVQLNTVIQYTPGSVYIKNKDGVYLWHNSFASNKMQSVNLSDSIVGKTDYDLFPSHVAENFRKNDLQVFNTGTEQTSEETTVLEDGSKIVQLSVKRPLLDVKGRIIGLIGNTIDISDRKKIEEELKQALIKAELANKAKTEFLSNIRHDLRTSLSGIQGSAELLRSEIQKGNGNSVKANEYADNLVASCRALTFMHNQILDAIRIFTGDVPEYKSKFNLEGKLKYLMNLHLAKADAKGLKFFMKYDKKIPKYLTGDCQRLSVIALQLIANAFKYTEKGKITVSAALEKKEGAKYIINFSVQDTGIGIPEEKKTEIFARFGRLTPAYEGKYAGLGLGLSIVKQFVDDLGGEIYVASAVSEGSKFTCYIPFAKSLSGSNENVDNDLTLPLPDMSIGEVSIRPIIKNIIKETAQPATSSSSGVKSILQVEDEEICILITKSTLEKLGFKVDIARNGQEALQKYRANYYDIILMDVGLPDISGTETTKQIRILEKDTNKHVPIIALTAHIDTESKQQCIESGMDAVLSKPISSDKFSEILNAFMLNHVSTVSIQEQSKKAKTKSSRQDEKDKELLVLTGEVIDYSYVKKKFSFTKEILGKLLKEKFMPSLARDMQSFKKYYKKKDWDMAQKYAHKIAGAATYCGTTRFKDACRRLETYIMQQKTKIRQELCEQISKEFKAVQDVVAKF